MKKMSVLLTFIGLLISAYAFAAAVQIWNPSSTYLKGDEVTYNGSVYEANWWTQSSPIENSGAYGSGQAWTLISSSNNQTHAQPNNIQPVQPNNYNQPVQQFTGNLGIVLNFPQTVTLESVTVVYIQLSQANDYGSEWLNPQGGPTQTITYSVNNSVGTSFGVSGGEERSSNGTPYSTIAYAFTAPVPGPDCLTTVTAVTSDGGQWSWEPQISTYANGSIVVNNAQIYGGGASMGNATEITMTKIN